MHFAVAPAGGPSVAAGASVGTSVGARVGASVGATVGTRVTVGLGVVAVLLAHPASVRPQTKTAIAVQRIQPLR